jgi:pyruvate dehydrogenase E1 component alpha subunit
MADRAKAWGMHSIDVDGQNVQEVYAKAQEALAHARAGRGPVFMNVVTTRLVGHYVGDPQVYRSKEETKELRESRDPIELLRAELGMSEEDFEALDRELHEIVDGSVEFAQAGTDPKPEDALKNVYA